ncbi:MAG: ATP-binding protein [Oscillospiraceae bacterium]|nr:ATP-binding protein [Oscillospiraceae bacterium]
MKKAMLIAEIPNAFRPEPLGDEDMEKFYEPTMSVRTGEDYDSPIDDIYDRCCEPRARNASLLMGHMGCGKSTELTCLAERLRSVGYPVAIIFCDRELDGENKTFPDVMILMADALLQLAQENKCALNRDDLETIRTFWTASIEKEDIIFDGTDLTVQAEAGVGAPKLLGGLIKLFANLKTSLKYNEESRTVYREQIVKYNSQWLGAMNRIADQITRQDGKQPILIFEDLDKGDTWNVFSGHGRQLTGVSFPVVYTFPIAYFYSPNFAEMESFFQINHLPMIKTRTIDGNPYAEGIAAIRAIVGRRAELALFEDGVLDELIDKTGGCLRHLFYAISKAARWTERKRETQISMALAKRALYEIRDSLSARIDGKRKQDDFLVEVYSGNHTEITDHDELLNMMKALTVLEYNGQRWYNVHPLIEEYLRDIGKLPPKKTNEG